MSLCYAPGCPPAGCKLVEARGKLVHDGAPHDGLRPVSTSRAGAQEGPAQSQKRLVFTRRPLPFASCSPSALTGQIERFYARNLPLSREMAKNLQSFGEG